MTAQAQLRRPEIRRILKRHDGAMASIARDLGITSASVSICLRGRMNSKRIMDACTAKALSLLEQEKAVEAGAA
jgi:hypothetical protein